MNTAACRVVVDVKTHSPTFDFAILSVCRGWAAFQLDGSVCRVMSIVQPGLHFDNSSSCFVMLLFTLSHPFCWQLHKNLTGKDLGLAMLACLRLSYPTFPFSLSAFCGISLGLCWTPLSIVFQLYKVQWYKVWVYRQISKAELSDVK